MGVDSRNLSFAPELPQGRICFLHITDSVQTTICHIERKLSVSNPLNCTNGRRIVKTCGTNEGTQKNNVLKQRAGFSKVGVQGAGCAFKVLREGPAATASHAFHAQIEEAQRQRRRFLLGKSARRSRPTRPSHSLMQPAPAYRCCLQGPPHPQWRQDAERTGGRYPENQEGRPGDWPCTRSGSDTPSRTGSADCCIS